MALTATVFGVVAFTAIRAIVVLATFTLAIVVLAILTLAIVVLAIFTLAIVVLAIVTLAIVVLATVVSVRGWLLCLSLGLVRRRGRGARVHQYRRKAERCLSCAAPWCAEILACVWRVCRGVAALACARHWVWIPYSGPVTGGRVCVIAGCLRVIAVRGRSTWHVFRVVRDKWCELKTLFTSGMPCSLYAAVFFRIDSWPFRSARVLRVFGDGSEKEKWSFTCYTHHCLP
jgi:hypothetical protein